MYGCLRERAFSTIFAIPPSECIGSNGAYKGKMTGPRRLQMHRCLCFSGPFHCSRRSQICSPEEHPSVFPVPVASRPAHGTSVGALWCLHAHEPAHGHAVHDESSEACFDLSMVRQDKAHILKKDKFAIYTVRLCGGRHIAYIY